MQVIVAKRAGFCFGVKRAVDIAFRESKKRRKVCTLGPIIHNPQVVQALREAGVEPVEDPVGYEAVLIRTHGVPRDRMAVLQSSGVEIIDATCPFVKKAQRYAKLLFEEGYQVLILGDPEHPEVKGILSYAGSDVVVVTNIEELPPLKERVGIVVQTTQPVTSLKQLVQKVIERTKELKVFNTICNSTALRLKETEEIAREADLMIVVGGKNSANTKQLASLCSSMGKRVYHIEEVSELKREYFNGVKKVGVTAGASTPGWIIQEVVEWLQAVG